MGKSITTKFRVSSFCDGGGCVAVAESAAKHIVVKSTITGKTLSFKREEWAAFTQGVKNNDFELDLRTA